MFDHEKLHVYQLQLEFLGWVTPVLAEAQQRDAGQSAEVRRQLDRASLSTLLNIAEGNGKRRQRTRAKSFDDALALRRKVPPVWMPWWRKASAHPHAWRPANRWRNASTRC
jgi:hypothetical protein